MSKGWIKLHRSIRDWEWADDPNMLVLWINMLLDANVEDREYRGHTIKRGELILTPRRYSTKIGVNECTIKRCIERLTKDQTIRKRTTNKIHILTIVNYE